MFEGLIRKEAISKKLVGGAIAAGTLGVLGASALLKKKKKNVKTEPVKVVKPVTNNNSRVNSFLNTGTFK